MALSDRRRRWPLRLSVASAAALGGAALAQGGATFADQVEAGRTAYATECAACHGEQLTGSQFAPALKGAAFLNKWGDAPLEQVHDYIRSSMPPARAGGLDDETYAALLALILAENGTDNGGAPLPADSRQLAGLTLPPPPPTGARDGVGVGGLAEGATLPPWPSPPDRFADYTPVTGEMLANPAPENWLTWRRAHNGHGYSPLRQINTGNVSELRVRWAQALPPGVNMNEPLVRDGVLYVFGYGDSVYAFDAADGRNLWVYQRRLPESTPLTSKKTLALWGDKLFTATSDNHLVALDARTGRQVWDVPLTDRPDMRTPGGPLAADGVIMQGLASQAPGGGLIVAFDAETGEKLWEFETVAKPGQPGGDSWNGIPAEERRGGSQWTSGTYDPESGLALWGVAQSYDTGPLRDRKPGMNNDALFTNSTLAFVPRTGELKWYFQHMKNDQYDLDWVFDRVIGRVEIDGELRRVVITGGKEGLFDLLDADTGSYIKTVDMGLQDFIVAIDPETGDKTPDPAKLPGRDRPPVFMCPHAGGGRNWSPTSFNPSTRMLFVNARDICMELVPAEDGFLSSGVNVRYAPRPGSDGMHGVLQAIDLESGEVVWETRRRQTPDMGILTTAGGLLFTGWMDRQVVAYDQATGRELWSSGVTGVPNASPITYAVDGKQYVAVVTGHGNPLAFGVPDVIPETQLPPVNSSAIYVFALPD